MPELPEVNTIKEQINEVLPIKVTQVELSNVVDSILHTPLNLKNKKIIQAQRHGKMLILVVDDGTYVLSHLGMSGSWRITKEKLKVKHNHIQIKHKDGWLSYVDPRRFGHMYHLNESEKNKKINQLGVDLLSKDYTAEYLKTTIKKYPERAIKVHLLDQKLYAGVGNYIASEICARAGVRPTRKNKTLTLSEIKRLHDETYTVINGANDTGGTTFAGGYADTTGSKGGGVTHLVVFYQKTCQMCKVTPVKKIVLAQRGTYYCPKCQK